MMETKVSQQYNQMASVYDRRWSGYILNTLLFLKNWAQIPPSATVLDVGCGTGEFEKIVLAENPTQHMVGVDISQKMLAIAQNKCHEYTNVSFQTASVLQLPFADDSFDVIVSASAFHYFDAPDAALTEMKRVLKPDGCVVILDWCRDYFLCQVCDILLKIFDPAYKQCYSQAEFHNLLAAAGFEIRRASKVRFGIVWGMMIATATPQPK
ncbi:class I SAM-dependent methyltransferase [Chlorogloeopsis fritschii PCC 9212]|uniref:SAM-dependent methyltransferase n=1 Tax=Chlorogloeopsis fritschii PCC 6912 TaxID=211165 RepID=A0A3S0Y1B9_CHLFR|nr:class I SAM-dependent methyltransferase [Chlorogloeopsis fritschii]RUR83147.1 SAM-dependent methyltransferase [Chlorogloeopsis fritschii PCC 6912]